MRKIYETPKAFKIQYANRYNTAYQSHDDTRRVINTNNFPSRHGNGNVVRRISSSTPFGHFMCRRAIWTTSMI
ncbi:hypothetical protein K1T71_007945 [Dendrolimus kikuchii]|uniref:Uncharacterized protein n=1 Tax=Dendrolimus kikuchii TaxID=765133 RepID=A0ACC1CYW7_9NEOP|nr:hypothetical protein K1T71_007945 [Dendrolimus kikuchii]